MPPITQFMRVDPRQIADRVLQDDVCKWMQFTLTYLAFDTAATTVNYDLTGIPAGTIIEGAFLRGRTNFTGPSIATAEISVGSTGTPDLYVAAVDYVSGNPRTGVGKTLVPGTFVNASAPKSAGTIRIQLVVSGANADVLTTGAIDVFLKLGNVKLYAGG